MKNIYTSMLPFLILIVANSCARAADAPVSVAEKQQVSVARVNNESITLDDLELALMKTEGAQIIQDLVREHMKTVDWSQMKDHDIVASVGDLEIPKVLLASRLLDKYDADTRDMLIQQMLIQQSLKTAGIILNQKLKDEMLQRMERRHYDKQEASGAETTVAFESLIQQQYGMTPQEWQKDPGFSFLAGTFALMYQTMEVPQNEIQEYFEDHKKRYGISEGYKLSIIPLTLAGKSDSVKHIRRRLAQDTYVSIHKKGRSFERSMKMLSPTFKEERGFVARDGSAEVKAVSRIPRAVMEAVFRRQYTEFPVLLPPIESENEITIVRVEAYRKGKRAVFEECRQQVRMDLIDSDTKRWIAHFLRKLRNSSDIEYGSLLDVKAERRQDLQKYIQKVQAEMTIESENAGNVEATAAPAPQLQLE